MMRSRLPVSGAGLAVSGLRRKRTLRSLLSLHELSRTLGPESQVSCWMDNPKVVEPGLSFWERTLTQLSLRALHSEHDFNLEDFLVGTRQAYVTCHQLIGRRDWSALESLVQPSCLLAETFTEGSLAPSEPEDYTIVSAVVSRARTANADHSLAHLEVSFRVLQTETLDDFRHGRCYTTLSDPPRLQQSKWTFERQLNTTGDAAEGAGWQVADIKWIVADDSVELHPH